MTVREYQYQYLTTDHGRNAYTVHERRYRIPEVIVEALWNREAVPGRVFNSRDGSLVRIVKPGRRGRYAGPDIRDAVVEINGRVLQGDIEIHEHPDDWRRHRHHLDPAYGNVLLHVVLWSGNGERGGLRSAARSSAFAPPVEIVLSSQMTAAFRSALEEAVTQARNDEGGLLCRSWNDAVPLEEKRAVLACMAASRFERKRAEMEERWRMVTTSGEDEFQVLYEYCARSLGYAANADPMQRLAHELPLSFWKVSGFSDEELFPALAVAAGLEHAVVSTLPFEERAEWRRSVDRVRRRVARLPSVRWVIGGVRPSNRPRRRLRVLAFWIPRFLDEDWRGKVFRLGRERPSAKALLSRVCGLFQPFGCRESLLGDTRLRAMLVNVLLPWLSLREAMPGATALRLFCSYPFRAPHSPARRVLEDLGIPRPWNSGDEQGALELCRELCNRNHCSECLIGFRA